MNCYHHLPAGVAFRVLGESTVWHRMHDGCSTTLANGMQAYLPRGVAAQAFVGLPVEIITNPRHPAWQPVIPAIPPESMAPAWLRRIGGVDAGQTGGAP